MPPTHPGRVGPQRNLTSPAAGRSLQGALEGRGNWGRGVTPHSDPGKHASGSKSAQAARLLCAAQKVLARFTDLQAMCAGGCRGEPPCPPPAVTHNYPLPPARAPSSLLFSRAASLAARGNTLALWGTPPKKTKRAVTPLRAPGRHNALEKGKNEEEARNSFKFLTLGYALLFVLSTRLLAFLVKFLLKFHKNCSKAEFWLQTPLHKVPFRLFCSAPGILPPRQPSSRPRAKRRIGRRFCTRSPGQAPLWPGLLCGRPIL